jgi:hypothetical protein
VNYLPNHVAPQSPGSLNKFFLVYGDRISIALSLTSRRNPHVQLVLNPFLNIMMPIPRSISCCVNWNVAHFSVTPFNFLAWSLTYCRSLASRSLTLVSVARFLISEENRTGLNQGLSKSKDVQRFRPGAQPTASEILAMPKSCIG